ncbi:MAG: dolichyl-phosphate beta-glucosyltransferase [Polyangiales bacterium]
MDLSLVIPAYNEAERLDRTVREVLEWARDRDVEIVVVDDGSTDGTARVLDAIASREPRIRGVKLPENRGKGAAVRAGVLAARGDHVAFFDADLAYPLDQLDALVAPLRAGADLAIGARDLHPENTTRYRLVRRVATAVFNGLVTTTLGLRVHDTQCGFKAFRREPGRALFSALTIPRFGFDVELLFLARKWGLRVERVPVRMRAHGQSSVRLVHDSVEMAGDLVRIRLRALRGGYPSSSVSGPRG